MSNLRIKDVRTIFTEPDNIRLVIVKIETNEPELYGVGCATFTQRPTAVLAAVEDYLKTIFDRQRSGRYRRYMAIFLRFIVLAKWTSVKQRFEWGRPGVMGYQG